MIDLNILHSFFRGETSEYENIQIKRWMEESPENKEIFLKEREKFDILLFYADYQDERDEQTHNRSHKIKYFFGGFLKIASVIVLTLAAVWFYLEKGGEADYPLQTIHVPAGQRVNLILPDGTDIWLNARTTLQYPVQFNKKERIVKLNGEAFFNVAKNKDKPFIVEALDKKVEVLGTEFNITAYSDKPDMFEVALMKGSVKLLSGQGKDGSLTLLPRYKAYLKDGKFDTQYIKDYDSYRWKEGLICFNNESIMDIIKKFENSYGIIIKVENEKIKSRLYTGKFRTADGIDYALRVLQKDIKFKYEKDDENYVIYIR